MQVAVIGPGEASEDECRTAHAVGAGLAAAGALVVTGGLGGVMEAATTGARTAGGLTLAILPGDDPTAARGQPSVVVASGIGEVRNALVVRAADAVVAIGGGWGTLSEVALAVRRGTPVVGVGTWGLGEDLDRLGHPDPVRRAADADEALALVTSLLRQHDPSGPAR